MLDDGTLELSALRSDRVTLLSIGVESGLLEDDDCEEGTRQFITVQVNKLAAGQCDLLTFTKITEAAGFLVAAIGATSPARDVKICKARTCHSYTLLHAPHISPEPAIQQHSNDTCHIKLEPCAAEGSRCSILRRWSPDMPQNFGQPTDEDYFEDDDFDNLPDSTLQQLEQRALSATQQARQVPQRPATTDHRLLPKSALSSRVQHAHDRAHKPTAYPHQPHAPQVDSNDLFEGVNFEDSDVEQDGATTPRENTEAALGPPQADEVTLREHWRQERFGRPTGYESPASYNGLQQSHPHTYHPAPSRLLARPSISLLRQVSRPSDATPAARQPTPAAGQIDESAYQKQLEALQREKEELKARLAEATTAVQTKGGEIAIIRENQRRESTTFDRQIAALKKSAQDEAARHQASLDQMRDQSRKLATSNQFLQHELDQEASKNKSLQKGLQQRSASDIVNVDDSPSRAFAHSLRDGFDDGDLMAMSPSRSGRRSKGSTPTAANKRKRKIDVQSPVPPLLLRQSTTTEDQPIEAAPTASKAEVIVPLRSQDKTAQKNLGLLQRVLHHRVAGEKRPLVEHFVDFTFPSDSTKTFTTILVEASSKFSGPDMSSKLLKVFLDLWSQALKEKYHKCIIPLLDIVQYMTAIEDDLLDGDLLTNLLSLLQSSAEINATIRFKNSPVSQANFGKFKQTPKSELNTEVDEMVCIEAIYGIACSCLIYKKKLNLFWRSMSMDFILLMLNSSQPISQITLILILLATSVLPDTFAMISDDEEEQGKMEGYIIDRVCWLLWETPRVDEGEPQPSRTAILDLRLAAMELLQTLAFTSSAATYSPHPNPSHGTIILTRHRHAIARLVRCLYDELAMLYTELPAPPHHTLTSPDSPNQEIHQPQTPPLLAHVSTTSTRPQHVHLVNSSIQLLHHLLTPSPSSPTPIDLPTKLSAINGCAHRYRVALTRLAFGETSVWHEGITEDTVSKAFELLEEVVTPEEAELLVRVFPEWEGRVARDTGGGGAGGQVDGVDERDGDEAADRDGREERVELEMAD